MEITGATSRRSSQLPCCRLESSDRFHQCLVWSANLINLPGDGNHRRQLRVACSEEKRKLLKRLEKDLALFAAMRFGINPNSGLAGGVQESLVAETAEAIMRQLQCVREAKRQRKKHKTESTQRHPDSVSTKYSGDVSSQKSTDGTEGISSNAAEAVAQVVLQCLEHRDEHDKQQRPDLSSTSSVEAHSCTPAWPSHEPTLQKRVEIRMGSKCKNFGGPKLLEQFQRLSAGEENVYVVECK